MTEFLHGFFNIAFVAAAIWVVFVYIFSLHLVGYVLLSLLGVGYFFVLVRDAAEYYERKPQ